MRGMYIAFEGLDGCGKTTQSKLLQEYLIATGVADEDIVLTKEPGSHLNGFDVRKFLLGHSQVDPLALEILFQADRAEHTAKVKEQLAMGRWVISDRCYASGWAYGLACGQTPALLNDLMTISVKAVPDIIFFLDVIPDSGRVQGRGEAETREEVKGKSFAETVRKNYIEAFGKIDKRLRPRCFHYVNGMLSMAEVSAKVTRVVELELKRWNR